MSARTVVGSGPRRRPLPMGRDAVDRAIWLCEFWHGDTPDSACTHAYEVMATGGEAVAADWLPAELRDESIEQLRERLRSYP